MQQQDLARKKKNKRFKAERTRAPKPERTHQFRLWTAVTIGLCLGTVVCWQLVESEAWEFAVPSVELSVPGGPTPTDVTDEKRERVADADLAVPYGPERVIDVGQIHPALGKRLDGAIVQELPEDYKVTFTVQPDVQARAEQILSENQVPYGAVVAINPKTGELIAMVDYEAKLGLHTGFALEATQPAASIFKVISSAALIEHAGVSPQKSVCYHGGKSGITKAELVPNPKRDTLCRSLTEALAFSSNVVFARLADKHLTPPVLNQWGEKFGFNQPLPFLWTVQESRLDLPEERVAFAGSAAGFHHSYVSPLHAAVMAGAVGNQGMLPMPQLVKKVERGGVEVYKAEPMTLGQAITPETSKTLSKMMERTTVEGTAAKYFNKRHKFMEGIEVAGKTGSLSSTIDGVRRHNSWFVGFAPAEDPEIAIAALVVNDPKWRIKGTYLAREIMEAYFISKARKGATTP